MSSALFSGLHLHHLNWRMLWRITDMTLTALWRGLWIAHCHLHLRVHRYGRNRWVVVSHWYRIQPDLLTVVEVDTKTSVLPMGERRRDTSMAALSREAIGCADISLPVSV